MCRDIGDVRVSCWSEDMCQLVIPKCLASVARQEANSDDIFRKRIAALGATSYVLELMKISPKPAQSSRVFIPSKNPSVRQKLDGCIFLATSQEVCHILTFKGGYCCECSLPSSSFGIWLTTRVFP